MRKRLFMAAAGGLYVETISISDVLEHDSRLDFELLKHVMAGVQVSTSFPHLCLTTDKSNVGGVQLQCGGFVTAANDAWVAVPQVALCTRADVCFQSLQTPAASFRDKNCWQDAL